MHEILKNTNETVKNILNNKLIYMLDKKLITQFTKDYEKYEIVRRTIIKEAGNILHKSKQAIFSLHRNDIKEAESLLKEAEETNQILIKKINSDDVRLYLKSEGSYKAALEEYAEAKLFLLFRNKKEITLIKKIELNHDAYIGGLCDFSGELVRYGIALATKNDLKEFERVKKEIEEIVQELIKLSLGGYLRTKFDQAKNNLRKIEEINYQLSLKSR